MTFDYVLTGNCCLYCFKALSGYYCVYLLLDWRVEFCVGVFAVFVVS
ncbi:hypothetical protein ACNIU7_28805 [Escherichia coli]